MLTNLRDAFGGQSRSSNVVRTIPYAMYSFLLCNSNIVFKMRRFYDIRLQKMSWLVTLKWGQRSLKVIENGIIRETDVHGFLISVL